MFDYRIVALVGLLSGCGGTEGTFSALTYNIAGLPEGLSQSSPEAHTPTISVLINADDLVLVQEDFSYHNLLVRAAMHPYQSEPLAEFDTLVNDGLNRFSQFPIGSLTRERWPSCHGSVDAGSDCLSSKGFSFSEVTLDEGVVVHVYNHHAEAGGGPEDLASRAAGFERLATFIQERSSGAAVIVGGDTNLDGFDTNDEPVLQAFMQNANVFDVCRTLSCNDEQIDRFFFRSSDTLSV